MEEEMEGIEEVGYQTLGALTLSVPVSFNSQLVLT